MPEPEGEVTFSGVEAATYVKGHYFDPLKGVKATSENGVDVTSDIVVLGNVQYGKAGTYRLTYKVAESSYSGSVARDVTIADGTYSQPARNKADGADRTITAGSGSYRTGAAPTGDAGNGNAFHRPGEALYVANEIYNEGPLPTNKWWSGFMTANYGGVTVAALNPLAAGYTSSGLYLSNKGTGFTQYFSVADTFGVAQTTMSNFSPIFKDLTIKPASLGGSNQTKIIGYDDEAVTIAMRNSEAGDDEMVTHLIQGSPFVFSEFKDPSSVSIRLRVEAVTKPYEFYDLAGGKITAGSYSGSALVIKLPGAHVGYATTYPNTGVGAAIYDDLYYLVNVPEGTSFTFSQGSHPSTDYKQLITLSMSGGDSLSICALNNLTETAFYHAGGYALPAKANVSYAVNMMASATTTLFKSNIQFLDGIETQPILALMPHQWKNSAAAVSGVSVKTKKGTTKMILGRSFATTSSFYGILPSYALPDDPSFSASAMGDYLNSLLADTVPGTVSLTWQDSEKHYINAPAPYWNGKALYPLSQGLIIADQLGLVSVKEEIISRIEGLLSDWFTYSGNSDVRYLYYDQLWGSMYYSVDAFSTGSRLSDHHFTAGYLIYGLAVVSMYDPSFLSRYEEIGMLLLKDYLNYDGDASFPSYRCYDPYAGHSWADGRGDFGDGNDQESCGEALNSWVAGYLLGTALGEERLVSAAAWGFSNELASIKQYWFNYDEDNWIPSLANYTHAIGILWGCKNDFQTWFGSNPEFIYGIHWLPTGEYLASYALGNGERAMLRKIYNEFLGRVNGAPRTWFSNMWAIQAIEDPNAALSVFDSSKILADDYPDELCGSYWMVHALQTLGQKDTAGHLTMNAQVAGTVYVNGIVKTALLWNPSAETQTVDYIIGETFRAVDVGPRSFLKVSL